MLTKAALTSFALEEQVKSHKLAIENINKINKSFQDSNNIAENHLNEFNNTNLTQTDEISLTETYDANRFVCGSLEPSTSVINKNDTKIDNFNYIENNNNKNFNNSKRLSLDIIDHVKRKNSNLSDKSISLEKSKLTNYENKKILKLIQELVYFKFLIVLFTFFFLRH